MSLRNKHVGALTLFLISWFFARESFSQSSAADWVKLGLDAATADAKIRAFEQAVQLDPNYIEAYYYLGLAYKARGRNEEAEIALNKAYFKNPYALNNEIKTRILYELGGIYQQLGKIDKAREALIGAKGLTSNAGAKGRICYDLGQLYLKEGNISSALAEFREGKSLLPQNAKLFDDAIQIAEGKKNLDDKYTQILGLMRAERYEDAAALLKEIIQVDPEFKDSAEKLEEATRLAQQSNQNKRLAALYSQGVNKARAGETSEAIALFRQIVALQPDYKDAQLRLQELQTSRRRPASASNQASAAADLPEPIRTQPPTNAAATSSFNPAAPANAGASRSIAPVADIPARKTGTPASFSDRISGNQSARPGNGISSPSANLNDRNLRKLPGTERALLTQPQQNYLAGLYEEGELAMQNGEWQQAVQAFEKIQSIEPGYRDVRNKLADARFNLNKKKHAEPAAQPQPMFAVHFMTTAAVMAALALAIIAFFAFSPVIRARIHLLRGQYDRAAAIYEKILTKKPGKIKLYSTLANIYLLENRRDERALKVFETIIRLNILTNKREEINSILANHYLNLGRTDMSAIKILEKELDTKMRKLKVYP